MLVLLATLSPSPQNHVLSPALGPQFCADVLPLLTLTCLRPFRRQSKPDCGSSYIALGVCGPFVERLCNAVRFGSRYQEVHHFTSRSHPHTLVGWFNVRNQDTSYRTELCKLWFLKTYSLPIVPSGHYTCASS